MVVIVIVFFAVTWDVHLYHSQTRRFSGKVSMYNGCTHSAGIVRVCLSAQWVFKASSLASYAVKKSFQTLIYTYHCSRQYLPRLEFVFEHFESEIDGEGT